MLSFPTALFLFDFTYFGQTCKIIESMLHGSPELAKSMCLAAAGSVAVAGCQTLALCVGSPGTSIDIKSFAVMCRVLLRLSIYHVTTTLHIIHL